MTKRKLKLKLSCERAIYMLFYFLGKRIHVYHIFWKTIGVNITKLVIINLFESDVIDVQVHCSEFRLGKMQHIQKTYAYDNDNYNNHTCILTIIFWKALFYWNYFIFH